MKFSNRQGGNRLIYFDVDDFIKINRDLHQIVDYRNIPTSTIDLTVAGVALPGSPSGGQLAAGTPAVPVLGAAQNNANNTQVLALVPEDDKERDVIRMAHLLVGIMPGNIVTFGAGSRTIGCGVRYQNPQAQPHWLTPDGQAQIEVSFEESPVDDPNELFPVFIFDDNTPQFTAVNRDPNINSCVMQLQGRMYRLKRVDELPPGAKVRTLALSEISQELGITPG